MVSAYRHAGCGAATGPVMSVSLESLMRDTIVDAPRPSFAVELVSFILVGGIAAGCFVLLSMAMIGLGTGLPAWIVSSGCYGLMIVPVYLAHRRFSFRSDTPHSVALPRYVMVQLSALGLAALFSFVFYSLLGFDTAMAALLVAGLTAGVNFVVLRVWAFARNR